MGLYLIRSLRGKGNDAFAALAFAGSNNGSAADPSLLIRFARASPHPRVFARAGLQKSPAHGKHHAHRFLIASDNAANSLPSAPR
jgi:hypothetical protein